MRAVGRDDEQVALVGVDRASRSRGTARTPRSRSGGSRAAPRRSAPRRSRPAVSGFVSLMPCESRSVSSSFAPANRVWTMPVSRDAGVDLARSSCSTTPGSFAGDFTTTPVSLWSVVPSAQPRDREQLVRAGLLQRRPRLALSATGSRRPRSSASPGRRRARSSSRRRRASSACRSSMAGMRVLSGRTSPSGSSFGRDPRRGRVRLRAARRRASSRLLVVLEAERRERDRDLLAGREEFLRRA